MATAVRSALGRADFVRHRLPLAVAPTEPTASPGGGQPRHLEQARQAVSERQHVPRNLLDSEWRATPKTVFRAWAADDVRDDPSKLARDMVHGLSLAGSTQRSINEVRRVLLDGRALQEQLDSVLTWHQPMTTPRSFTLVLPLARMGTVPGAFGWRRRRLDELPQTFQAVMAEAVLAGHAAECDKFLEVSVEAIDANAAVAIFQEQFDRYLLRLPTAASKTKLPTKPMVLVGDPAPSVAARVIRFRLPPRYGYGRPNYLNGSGLSRIVRAASEDALVDSTSTCQRLTPSVAVPCERPFRPCSPSSMSLSTASAPATRV